jgi:hypothetical protein
MPADVALAEHTHRRMVSFATLLERSFNFSSELAKTRSHFVSNSRGALPAPQSF